MGVVVCAGYGPPEVLELRDMAMSLGPSNKGTETGTVSYLSCGSTIPRREDRRRRPVPLRVRPREKLLPDVLVPELIAPCGMDCGLCMSYVRDKNGCLGCRAGDEDKAKSCRACTIRNCEVLRSGESAFCSSGCGRFPCPRLKRLDVRYRTKYRMSMLENLRVIGDKGIEAFVASEQERWACPECGGLQCVHTPECVYCGHVWL